MNSFTDFSSDEQILRQERPHPGIFAIPVLVLIAMLLPTAPFIFFLKTMENIFAQMNAQGGPPGFSLLWAVPILLDLVPTTLVFLLVLVAYLKSEVTLTDKRLIYRTGLIQRNAGELPLENIEGMFITEPLLGRLLGYGTVTVSTLGGMRFALNHLAKPHLFHADLQRAVAQAKSSAYLAPRPTSALQDDSRYMPRG